MPCPIGTDAERAAAILRGGGLVAFATETVYGLGANALDPIAVARVFEAKDRPEFDPLIVHIADRAWLSRLTLHMPNAAEELAARFWPGPLSLVLPKAEIVPDLVTSGLPTVAVRIPDHELALKLLRTADVPVAAPSANSFGRISPTTAAHVADQLGEKIDYILDGGPCRVGLESTVLDLSGEQPRLLRPGGLPLEAIEAVIGPVETSQCEHALSTVAMPAPGMLSKHYAPRTRLIVSDDPVNVPARGRVGVLTFELLEVSHRFESVEVLSETGDLREAAAKFFAALRRLDEQRLDLIIATPFPNHDLGRALNDRLRRAAHT